MAEAKPKLKKGISLSVVVAKLKRQTSLFFWIALLILLALEGLVLKRSIALVLSIKNSPEPLQVSQTVRVNFNVYDAVAKRLEAAGSYVPASDVSRNPFTYTVGTATPPPASNTAAPSNAPATNTPAVNLPPANALTAP